MTNSPVFGAVHLFAFFSGFPGLFGPYLLVFGLEGNGNCVDLDVHRVVSLRHLTLYIWQKG
jgi:hypothetical protein